jgi:hypothetical protein
MRWPEMGFCFIPGASHPHMDGVGCTGTPFRPNNVYILLCIGYLFYVSGKTLMIIHPFKKRMYICTRRHQITEFKIMHVYLYTNNPHYAKYSVIKTVICYYIGKLTKLVAVLGPNLTGEFLTVEFVRNMTTTT